MTRERFEQTNYYGKISYETYQRCDCSICIKENCIHRDAYRRMPAEADGLGLCPNLKANYKLRVYIPSGIEKGNLDHEEYFDSKEEMEKRYDIFASYRMGEPLPTAWEIVDGEWGRMEGY